MYPPYWVSSKEGTFQSCAILAFYFSVGFLSVAYAMLIGWIAMTCYELPKMISFHRGKEKGKT